MNNVNQDILADLNFDSLGNENNLAEINIGRFTVVCQYYTYWNTFIKAASIKRASVFRNLNQ